MDKLIGVILTLIILAVLAAGIVGIGMMLYTFLLVNPIIMYIVIALTIIIIGAWLASGVL